MKRSGDPPACVARLVTAEGQTVAVGTYNPKSAIAVRVLDRAERLLSEVLPLITDPEALERMSHACHGLVSADAAGELARIVLDTVRRS